MSRSSLEDEYMEDITAIMENDDVEAHIKNPQDAIRFTNLSARLGINLNGTSVTQWLDGLVKYVQTKAFAEYCLTKETQKSLFQSPFFRQLVPDMQRLLAKDFIPKPTEPPLLALPNRSLRR